MANPPAIVLSHPNLITNPDGAIGLPLLIGHRAVELAILPVTTQHTVVAIFTGPEFIAG